MKHLYVFYFFITFTLGIVSLGIAVVLYAKTKERVLQYYLGFYSAFTLIVILNVVLFYMGFNVPTRCLSFLSLDYFESFIAGYIFLFTLPLFFHQLFAVPHTSIKNVIVAVLIVLACISEHLTEFILPENSSFKAFGEYAEDVTFLAIILYSLVIGMYYYKYLQEKERKALGKRVLILIGIFLPGVMNDTFLSEYWPIRFYPILYCSFGILFTHYFLKNSMQSPQISEEKMPDEDLFKTYNISSREQEIVLLVLKGYSNQKIGEELCISLSTVKTHLRNIYPKFGIKSRYKLIALFNDAKVGTE